MKIALPAVIFHQLPIVAICICQLVKYTSWQKVKHNLATSWKIHIEYFSHGGLLFNEWKNMPLKSRASRESKSNIKISSMIADCIAVIVSYVKR